MENETLQRRSTATINQMGINSYSTFGAQGDLTNDKLTISPVLPDTNCITSERSITDIKQTFYDEQLSSSNSTMNWDMEPNYICPPVVHHPSNNNYIHLTECVLQPNPSTTVIQNTQTIKLNNDDDIQHDGNANPTQQPSASTIGAAKQNFANFTNTDLNGSKVIRLVRAKQATKRKSSLDTLIEVVQKELLRVNGQSNSTSPPSSPPHYSQTRSTTLSSSSTTTTSSSSKQSHPQQQQRSITSSVLPSSHPNSLTSQSNHPFKPARKRTNHQLNNAKRIPSNRHRNKSFNNNDEFTDDIDFMDDDDINNSHNEQQQQQQINESIEDDIESSPENIEEIVRDTVDKLVAITLLNNAPFIVNMITGTPGTTTSSTNTESKPLTNIVNTNTTSTTKPVTAVSSSSDYYRNDLALLSSTATELRSSMQQTSPIKQSPSQQQQIIVPSNSIQTNPSIVPTEQIKSSTPALFVAPRILNFQTVVPKPTTNIQIGNTKIILVSPSSNLSQTPPQQQHQPQSTLVHNSPVKLVKLSSALPKNVQIVIPSRTSNESLSTTTLHPLTTCSIDQIPQPAQEVTITTSPNLNKLRRRSSTTTPIDKPVGKILRPIAKVLPVYSQTNSNIATSPSSTITTSPRHDELTKPMAINFQQRPTHGPMIYRMTSVNSNVPVFRVRATTTPTTTALNTDAKSISVATATSMCYEPKQTHNATSTTSGSVSVLACFKTTKKRNKERAIMPRPTTADSIDTSHDLQQRLNTTTTTMSSIPTSTSNVPLTVNSHNTPDGLTNGNSTIFSSNDYRQQSTSTRLLQSYSLPTTQQQQQTHNDSSYDLNLSLPNSISIQHANSKSIKTITTPITSPIKSLCSTGNIRPSMEDKCIQCIDDNENSREQHEEHIGKSNISKKRNGQSHNDNSSSDESWTVAADTLLRNVLSQYGFRFLDVNCQQNLLNKFDTIQANLVSGMILSKDEFYKSVHDIKDSLVKNGLSKISADNLEKLFNYFELEYPKIRDGDSVVRTNDRKRARRQ